MKRVPVPDGSGGELGWFDLRDMSELNEDHQLEYLDLADKLRQDKRDALAAADALANPAVMPDPDDETPVKLTRKELGPIRDLVEGWVIVGSSFPLPLSRPQPLPVVNVLRVELDPYYDALNGTVVPNGSPASASTSSATSPDPVTAPPAPSEPEP